ncbi:hypothetical protein BGZ80_010813 [Entomortierella chlamydospora]|uniref:Uncharacterized protein n=1 Tax=Entomortierella chlamydospora TaxID=101097 RepID=A0A9P6MV38_9FUNG|nr:hypothetical protein BGZ80_010813 [Entomortierella chlamydospora]
MTTILNTGSDAEMYILDLMKQRTVTDKEISGKIILVGPKGCGKVAVANMLVQGKLLATNRIPEESKEEVREGRASLQIVDGRGWIVCVVDEFDDFKVGYSDEAVTVRQNLKYVLREGKAKEDWGFNAFCLVLRCDQVMKFAMDWYAEGFRKLLDDAVKRLVLIVTDCDRSWIENHEKIISRNYADFVFVPVQFNYDENLPNMSSSQCDASLKALDDTFARKNFLSEKLGSKKKNLKSVVAPQPEQQQQIDFGNSRLPPTYNILIIGQTQSGKSTLVQAFQRYENPNCKLDPTKIGRGVTSCTTEVLRESISTNLPEYHIVSSNTKEPIKLLKFFENSKDPQDRKVTLGIAKAEQNRSSFQIFDTPGLDDTDGSDVSHIRKILEKIMKVGKIHLVIVVVNSQAHFSEGHKKALLTYKNVLSTLGEVMIFLHTKVPIDQQTSRNDDVRKTMQQRYNIINGIMQSDVPHLTIDNNINESDPARKCVTLNRIAEILRLAIFNKPVIVATMSIHKTEKMIEVDSTVVQHFRDILREKDNAYMALDASYQLRARIDNVERSINQMEDYIRCHETSDLFETYFNHFNENWRFFYIRDVIVFECPPQPYPIDDKKVLSTAVNVLSEQGGRGHDHWMIRFKRKQFENGSFYVRLFTEKRHRFRREISICKTQLNVLKSELASLRQEMEIQAQRLRATNGQAAIEGLSQAMIDELVNTRKKYTRIIHQIDTTTLSWEMFKDLDELGAYKGSDVELSVWKVRKERGIMDKEIFAKTILVGPNGDGKAAVANMLIQGKLFLRNCVTEESVADEQMERATLQLVDGRGWVVCIVDGIEDLVEGESEEAVSVKQDLLHVMKEGEADSGWGFNMFCLVLRSDHVFNAEAVRHTLSFRRLFANNTGRLVLIVTGVNDKWVTENKERLESEFGDFLVVPVQFLFDENMPNMGVLQRLFGSKKRNDVAPKAIAQRSAATEYSSSTPIYNILVLGQSQSGKSTLIQAIRKYANPTCTIDFEKIGDGNRSHTRDVVTEHVYTDLPEYEVIDTKKNEPIKIVQFFEQPRKYREEMNQTRDRSLRPVPNPESKVCHFQIFDTPGLDDTDGIDVRHIRKTLSDIRAAREIHLVIIMVNSQVPISQGLQDALKTYKTVFSIMGDLMIFLHSKVRNEHQTPGDTGRWPVIQQRFKLLDEIMKQKIPHFMINCDFEEESPVHNCFTYNKILSILQLATFNEPVQVDAMPLHKTGKMIEVDEVVAQHYKALFESEDRTCKQLDIAYQLKTRIDDALRSIEELKSFIRNHDTDRLVLIFQERFDENWRYFYRREPIVYEYKPHSYPIDRVDVLMFSVAVMESAGGKGFDYWRVKFIRDQFKFGTYHVKLYTKQRNKFRREISVRRTQLMVLENELESLEEQQRVRLQQLREARNGAILDPLSEAAIAEIMNRRERYARILGLISNPTLTWGMYRALDEAKAYEGKPAVCSVKVQAFYSTYQPSLNGQ